MPPTAVPDIDLARVRRWCEDNVPAQLRNDIQVECHVRGKSVTLCETRPPWNGEGEWSHESFAQLRYRPDTLDWALYWADRNTRWHEYAHGGRQFGTMAQLLAEIDEDPSCIFRG